MSIERTKVLLHWNYFLSLEEDLLTISRYVEFASVFDEEGNEYKNDSVFSTEIAKLLLNAGSEIDVILKEICKNHNSEKKVRNINEYRNVILASIPNFVKVKVTIPRLGLKELNPWELWNTPNPTENPTWWKAYNNVKHNRNLYFQEANIKNCLNAMAALYICVLFLYKDEAKKGKLYQIPKLFNIEDRYFGGTSMGRYGNSFAYNLEIN